MYANKLQNSTFRAIGNLPNSTKGMAEKTFCNNNKQQQQRGRRNDDDENQEKKAEL